MGWLFKNTKTEEEKIIEYLIRHGILIIDTFTDSDKGVINVYFRDKPEHIQYYENGLKFNEIVINHNYKED